MAPRDIATLLITACSNNLVDRCDIAGPGFINFVNQSQQTGIVRTIIEAGETYGRSTQAKDNRHRWNLCCKPYWAPSRGHGRGAAIGDSLGRLLEATGWTI